MVSICKRMFNHVVFGNDNTYTFTIIGCSTYRIHGDNSDIKI